MLLLVRVVVAAVILVFVPATLEQFEVPKAMVVRVAGIGALVVLAAGAAKTRGASPAKRMGMVPLDWVVLAWLAVEILATATSVAPTISLLGDEQQHEGLLTSLGLAGVYFATRRAMAGAEGPGRLARLLDTILAMAALSAVYALLQVFHLDPMQWFHTASYDAAGASRYVRPFGTLSHPNLFGVVAAAAMAACIARAWAGQRLSIRHALGALLFGVVTVLTLSRGAWLGAVAGLLLPVTLAAPAGVAGRRGRVFALLAAGAVIALALALLGSRAGMIGARLHELLAPSSGTAGARQEIWRAAWAMWRARPWLGQGPDAFALVYPAFQTPAAWHREWATEYFHAHDVALHTLATRGVAGLLASLAWVAATVLAALHALRRERVTRSIALASAAALVAMLVAGVFGALGIAGATLAVMLTAILATVASHEGRDTPAEPDPRHHAEQPRAGRAGTWHGRANRGRQKPVRGSPRNGVAWDMRLAAGWAAGFAVAVWCVVELAASHAAFDAMGSGQDVERSVAAARRALALDPASDLIAFHAADALAVAGTTSPDPGPLLDEAEAAARRSIVLQPLRFLGHQVLGGVLLKRARLGDAAAIEPAVRAYDEALTRAPYNALIMLEAAQGLVYARRPELALGYAERAARLYPEQPIVSGMLGWVRQAVARRQASP